MANKTAYSPKTKEMTTPPPSTPTSRIPASVSPTPAPPTMRRLPPPSRSWRSFVPSLPRCLPFLMLLLLIAHRHDVIVVVNANLSEPTLVGIEKCHPLPSVRLPLYWSGEHSPDHVAHSGPTNVSSTVLDIGGGDDDDRRRRRGRRTKVISTPQHMGVLSSTDGTIRASVADVSLGSPVIVVLLAYADLGECGELAATLSEVVREVNMEYLADALHPHEADPSKSPPPVAGVVINAALPLRCDEHSVQGNENEDDPRKKAERCASKHPEWLEYANWQGKLLEGAGAPPAMTMTLPVLQDTVRANAFDEDFGGYYNDFIIYMDGTVYEYLPSELALMHSDWLRMEYGGDGADDRKKGGRGDDVRGRLKEATMGALNHVGEWCREGGGGGGGAPPSASASASSTSSAFGGSRGQGGTSSSSSTPWYDRTFLASYVDDTEESIGYDVALGFVFAAFSTSIMVLFCMAYRFLTSKCCPTDSRRKMKHGHHDGLGMFQILTQHDHDDYDCAAAGGDYWSESDDDDDLVRNEYGQSGVEDDDEAVHRFEINRAAREFAHQCGDDDTEDDDEEEMVLFESEADEADDEKDDNSNTKEARGGGGGGDTTEEVTSTSSRSGTSRGGSSSRGSRGRPRPRPGDRPPPPPTMDLEMIERRIVQSMQPHPPPMPPKDLLS